MKKIVWYILTFISCLAVGLVTRVLAKQVPLYGFHAVLAAFPVSFLLVLCFRRTADKPVWIQIIPILLFGLFLGMMSPVMAFCHIGAAALAAVLTCTARLDKASVLAFGYAFFNYPLAVLGSRLLGRSAPDFDFIQFMAFMAVTFLLSFLGAAAGERVFK